MKTCQLHCTPVSVSNALYSGQLSGSYTGISISDKIYKVYEDECQLHCYPAYQSVTQGIAACHLTCTPEYQSATKTCQLHCTPMYQPVTWGIHLECIGPSATKYTKTCQLNCSPVYQSVTRDISACHPECFWNIGQQQKR